LLRAALIYLAAHNSNSNFPSILITDGMAALGLPDSGSWQHDVALHGERLRSTIVPGWNLSVQTVLLLDSQRERDRGQQQP
jgi:hypothetical protein